MISVFVKSVANRLDDVVQIWLLHRQKQPRLHLSQLPFAGARSRHVIGRHTDPDGSVLGKRKLVLIPGFEEGVPDPSFVVSRFVRRDSPELITASRQIRPCSSLPLRFPRDEEFDCDVTYLLSYKISLYAAGLYKDPLYTVGSYFV